MSAEDRLDRVLDDLVRDQWVDDFIKRLKHAIGEIVPKK
jgi:hypothetical protein